MRRIPQYLVTLFFLFSSCSTSLPTQTKTSTGRWRGFNLTNLAMKGPNESPYEEEDFKWIHELGFNFIRLPLDFRIWTDPNDAKVFDEQKLKQIDQAIQFGQKYKIHVCLSLHAGANSATDDPVDFYSQWQMFATRYQGIASSDLSFNLSSDQTKIDVDNYQKFIRDTVTEIWEIDPNRLVLIDGLDFGKTPLLSLARMPLIQVNRSLGPSFMNDWSGATSFPVPTWPMTMPRLSRKIHRLKIQGKILSEGTLRILVGDVPRKAKLIVKANGKLIEELSPSNFGKLIKLPKYTNKILLSSEGANFEIEGIKIIPPQSLGFAPINLIPTKEISEKLGVIALDEKGKVQNQYEVTFDRKWLTDSNVVPWLPAQKLGIKIFVSEFGTPRAIPHPAALAWMEDHLNNWKGLGWGWALSNFKGSFGILDSKRTDAKYEDFHGHKLDRKMLNLLQKY